MSLELLKNALQDASLLLRPGHAHYPLVFEDDGTTPKKLMPTWLIDSVQLAIEDTAELQGTMAPKMHSRFPEFDSLCSAVIRKIVEDQGFPNWENRVLGISTAINDSAEGR